MPAKRTGNAVDCRYGNDPLTRTLSRREKGYLVSSSPAFLCVLCDLCGERESKLPDAKTDHERTFIQRPIDTTDKAIDKLVYELYDLTEEEIARVEGASGE